MRLSRNAAWVAPATGGRPQYAETGGILPAVRICMGAMLGGAQGAWAHVHGNAVGATPGPVVERDQGGLAGGRFKDLVGKRWADVALSGDIRYAAAVVVEEEGNQLVGGVFADAGGKRGWQSWSTFQQDTRRNTD